MQFEGPHTSQFTFCRGHSQQRAGCWPRSLQRALPALPSWSPGQRGLTAVRGELPGVRSRQGWGCVSVGGIHASCFEHASSCRSSVSPFGSHLTIIRGDRWQVSEREDLTSTQKRQSTCPRSESFLPVRCGLSCQTPAGHRHEHFM